MPADFFASPAGYLRVGAIILAMAAVVALMQPLGFRLAIGKTRQLTRQLSFG